MAGFFRSNSDRTPLLRSNLPISSGPAEPEDAAEPKQSAPVRPPRETVRTTLQKVVGPAADVIPPSQRKAAMNGLDEMERKWSFIGLVLDAVVGVVVTAYLVTHRSSIKSVPHTKIVHGHKVVTHVKTLVPLNGNYYLVAGVVIVVCIIGLIAWQRRKRTLVAFAFFLTGFAFTLIFAPFGLGLILVGGWLMLRAYRIQKYGTPNARQAAQEARNRPPRQSRNARAAAAATQSTATGKKPPAPSKRYTPKQAPRKKVPKQPTA